MAQGPAGWGWGGPGRGKEGGFPAPRRPDHSLVFVFVKRTSSVGPVAQQGESLGTQGRWAPAGERGRVGAWLGF